MMLPPLQRLLALRLGCALAALHSTASAQNTDDPFVQVTARINGCLEPAPPSYKDGSTGKQYLRFAVRRTATVALTFFALCGGAAIAQDAVRGRQLFENTRGVTGKPVGNCVSCHATQAALREMIANKGGKPNDPRSVRRVLQAAIDGAVPGAANAKAQFRGVLTNKDLDDLARYLAGAKSAARPAPMS